MHVIVAPMKSEDAAAARALIIEGLAERWGRYEPRFNPDLENFAGFYDKSVVLLAKESVFVVGTGVLCPRGHRAAEIVRMSVARTRRRCGIGSLILRALLDSASERGYVRVTLETTATWESSIKFYMSRGFVPTHSENGNQHFVCMPT